MNRYPELLRVEQTLHRQAITDIAGSIHDTIADCTATKSLSSGHRVAIAVGSRGIANLAVIVKAVVDSVRTQGALPFIVPAMGSHGGASAAGQLKVLASHGITESAIGCPIESSMETVSIGQTAEGFDVRFDGIAAAADHVIVVNRIKPHTRLIGDLQSGLVKMLMIGLGNHDGAAAYHQSFATHDYRLDAMATEISGMIMAKMPITMGLAIIEDGAEQTSHIEAVAASEFLTREPALLEMAAERMPSLPFRHADLLIIDHIGKEISGTGMDTNVIGRKWNDNVAAADEWPKIKQIYVRSLTNKTAGNAAGIGIAEYCHQNVVDHIDIETTKINCITSEHVTAGRIPLTFANDRQVFDAVVSQMAATSPSKMKWMAIRDTLSLSEVFCSTAYFDSEDATESVSIIDPPAPIQFDADGNIHGTLASFFSQS